MNFNKEWLQFFEKCHKLDSLNSFEESGDADEVVFETFLMASISLLKEYRLARPPNADVSGFSYRMERNA